MEIIDRGEQPGAELVQIAFADNSAEAALLLGLLEEAGMTAIEPGVSSERRGITTGGLSGGRIFVPSSQSEAARRLLAETMVEGDPEEKPSSLSSGWSSIWGKSDDAETEDAPEGKGRDYSHFGAFPRFCLVAFVVLVLASLVIVLLR